MAYPGFQRGGCLRSGPYEKWGGGGGRFRSDIRKVEGGALQVQYTKSGGGGGGGGGPFRFRSDTFAHTENIYMYLPTCYLGILHTRARIMPAKVNLP